MELQQQQVQQLSRQQLQSVELLQMSTQELELYIRDLAQENPLIDLDDSTPSKDSTTDSDRLLLDRLKWLEDNDHQNSFYQKVDQDEMDPLLRVGTSGGLEETLVRFVSRQLIRRRCVKDLSDRVCFLAACLDRSGYLTQPLEELAPISHCTVPQLEEALTVLQSLEPAGIGAANLSQCLEFQLNRIGEKGPALSIVRSHLEHLARGQIHAIAAALSISQGEVRKAAALIRELEPRPGAVFEAPEPIRYIQPDVIVAEEDGRFVAHVKGREQFPFHVSSCYLDMLEHSPDSEVRTYLNGKLHQIETLRFAIGQRESTLQQCAQAVVDRQQDFFRLGPSGLRPVTMGSIAAELGIHESTVSRAVREKFLQCRQGVFPLRYFFVSGTTSGQGESEVSRTAAQALLQKLISEEDRSHPLSDQRLAEQMAQSGCPISRRTVAKYREELNIPNTAARRL